MKTIKSIKSTIVVLFLFVCFNTNAQNLTQNQKIKDNNTVRMYSFEELDDIQLNFQEGMLEMKLIIELEEEYINVIVAYIGNVSRLDVFDEVFIGYQLTGDLSIDTKYIKTVVPMEIALTDCFRGLGKV